MKEDIENPEIRDSKPRLLDQVRDRIRTKHYSIRTEQTYIGWIKRFILFHDKRHPAEMAEKEIAAFLTHLAVNRKVAASTQNQALSAIVFLYREIIQKELGEFEDLIWAKKPSRLPVVFTQDEVKKVLTLLEGNCWLMGQLLYGAGLRIMECMRLRAGKRRSEIGSQISGEYPISESDAPVRSQESSYSVIPAGIL